MKETHVTSIDFNIPSTSKGKGRRNDSTKNTRSFCGSSAIVKSSGPLYSKENKIIKIDWRKQMVYFFFFISDWLHWLGYLYRGNFSFLSNERKCNLEFRKCGIKDREWSKISQKCGIKECKWWLWFRKCGIKECEFSTKFAFFNSAFFLFRRNFFRISFLIVLA